MEGFVLRTKDQLKLEVICKVYDGRMNRLEAQRLLNISERTLRRYVKKYSVDGIKFIKHGNFRRAPKNKTSEGLRKLVQKIAQEKYYDFNITHLREKILEELGVRINYETLRKWCHEINLVKKAKRRRTKPRFNRPRMTQEGLFEQMDGSHHYWFGGRFLCLLAIIDDATSEVYARFYEGETSIACMDFLNRFVAKKGRFKVLYTDRAGVYGGIKREHFSQVERALGELGTQVIYAHSPEAKGRVERLFSTLQDRLVPEMRLQGISTIEEANEYLERYLPNVHNPNYMVQAQNPISAYEALPAGCDLNEIFCMKEYRVVGKDHTISVQGFKWMISDPLKHSIARQLIELRFDKYGKWEAYFAGRKIKLTLVQKLKKAAA
jgi:transposase